MKEMRTTPLNLLAFLLFLCSFSYSQSYSDATAPVGNAALTVPAVVRPVMDHWMRDTYVMLGPDGNYYMTGTTASPGRVFGKGAVHCWDYNDGLYLWKSKDLQHWDSLGLIWSFDKDAAPWQKKGKPVPHGALSLNKDPLDSMYRAVWAPELHYIKSRKKWLLIACLNGGQGSFVLESVSGKPEGPYKNIPANNDKAIFPNIDLGLFEDDNGEVYLVGHNHFIEKMNKDLTGLAEPFKRLQETPYNPDPYIEGVYITKRGGKYQLLQTVWSIAKPDGSYTYVRDEKKDGKALHSYDVVVAESDNVYGPYGPRYAAILQGGHNNLFVDKKGDWWSTTFFNPRGAMGTEFEVTCRPGLVPVKWQDGKLRPDHERAAAFYARNPEIGANFNHDPEIIDFEYLKKTPVEWIRTTPYIFQYINGQKNAATEPGLAKVIEAKKKGYKVAFGYRWDFRKFKLRIPEPGSVEEQRYFSVARELLDRVGAVTDIFKLGNEPNLETMPEDLQRNAEGVVPLVRFTERLLTQVVEPWYAAHTAIKRPQVYVGSLPRLFMKVEQETPGVVELIRLAQQDKRIAGLSVHLHISDSLEMEEALRFARSIMPEKPIIVPEFSLFRLYNKHNNDELGASFAGNYGYTPTMKLYEWYSKANTEQVSTAEWKALFDSRPWFPQHFMLTYYRYFQKYGVVLATYGYLSQDAPKNMRPDSPTWFINPVFPFKSLKPLPDGSHAANPLWVDDFIKIVNWGKLK